MNTYRAWSSKLSLTKPAAAEAVSNVDGTGHSARERQVQELDLGNEVALWRNVGPPRHWFIHGRLPPGTGYLSRRVGDVGGHVGGDT